MSGRESHPNYPKQAILLSTEVFAMTVRPRRLAVCGSAVICSSTLEMRNEGGCMFGVGGVGCDQGPVSKRNK